MSDYLEVAWRTLATMAGPAEPNTESEPPVAAVPSMHEMESNSPPAAEWPESSREQAERKSGASGDSEAARREVWLSWEEWKATALNGLFQEQGTSGLQSRITAATVRHGERKGRAPQATPDGSQEPKTRLRTSRNVTAHQWFQADIAAFHHPLAPANFAAPSFGGEASHEAEPGCGQLMTDVVSTC
jgi:hypothetical protein